MLFPKVVLYILFASIPSLVLAAIDTLAPYPGTYHATRSSVFPLTFRTSPRPTTARDLSVAVGLSLASTVLPETVLGERFIKNYNLDALGHSSTGVGNFTIRVPLRSRAFYAGSGNYSITVGLTSAFGAQYGAVLNFKRINVTVTV